MNKDEVSRRDFLQTAAVGSAAAAWASVATGCAAFRPIRPDLRIIDAHVHFYDPTRPAGVPWPSRDDAFLYRPVYPAEFEKLARPLGVTSAVVVEASPWIEDNEWILELTRRHADLVGVVGHLRPGEPAFGSTLVRFARKRGFRGIRIGGEAIARAGRDDAIRRDLGRLAKENLTLDVLVGPDQLSAVASLAESLRDLRIVIDHCGNVPVNGKSPPVEWVGALRRCALQPNLSVKVSGLVEGSGRQDGAAPRDLAFYRPVLDELWDAFGPDRVIYASNWPVSARFATYETVFRIVEEYFNARGSGVAHRFFSDNAARIYRLQT